MTCSSTSSCSATTPAGTAGTTVDVLATANGKTSSANAPADQFTYNAATSTPTVTGVLQQRACCWFHVLVTDRRDQLCHRLRKHSVLIRGRFRDRSCDLLVDEQPSARTPAGTAGTTVDVLATANGKTSSANAPADQFTYNAGSPPVVSSISPTTGPTAGGTTVTITGTGLTSATSVKFGTYRHEDERYTDLNNCDEPSRIGSDRRRDRYDRGRYIDHIARRPITYVLKPVVTAISPTSGLMAGGDTVTITGSSLSTTTAVDFGTTAAPSFTIQMTRRSSLPLHPGPVSST